MKVLFGEGYDVPRLVGIKAEMWARVTEKEPPITDTQFATGVIVVNTTTLQVGLLIDPMSAYFANIPAVHMVRMVDVIDGDGWCTE